MTNVLIIDASGSMSGRVNDVRGGIKQTFEDIKEADKDPSLFKHTKKKKKSRTIVIDFADDIRTLVDVSDSDELKGDIAENYRTRGSTALYDAIGQAFSMIPEDEDKVFVNIITDGEENASRRYSGSQIKEMIEGKKAKGWAILFLGTDESCINAAQRLGVSRGSTITFAGAGGQYSSADNVMGKAGYNGTLNNARTMYMASTNALASEDLLYEAEVARMATDKTLGLLDEVEEKKRRKEIKKTK